MAIIGQTKYPMKKPKLDVRTLPVGTEFFVINGAWYGVIIEIDGKRYIEYETGVILIPDKDPELRIMLVNFPKEANNDKQAD